MERGMSRQTTTLRYRIPLLAQTGLRALLVVGLATLLYGCGSPVTQLQSTASSGDTFTATLAREYQVFSTFEAEEMVDWPDAEHFARKGLKAAQGQVVKPEIVSAWMVPPEERDALDTARNRLAWVLATGAVDDEPVRAATAQARFDCWIEQQEENWQPLHIAACRDGFYSILRELEDLEGPRSARLSLVMFKFDSDEIDDTAQPTLDALVGWAHAANATAIRVTGHTDRAGSETYNIDLSLRRALAVRAELVQLGVHLDRISYSGAGESQPRVATADGMRELGNRRVEIRIELPDLPKKTPKMVHSISENRKFAVR